MTTEPLQPGTAYVIRWTDPGRAIGYRCPRARYVGSSEVDALTVRTFDLEADTHESIGSTMAAGGSVHIAAELLVVEGEAS